MHATESAIRRLPDQALASATFRLAAARQQQPDGPVHASFTATAGSWGIRCSITSKERGHMTFAFFIPGDNRRQVPDDLVEGMVAAAATEATLARRGLLLSAA